MDEATSEGSTELLRRANLEDLRWRLIDKTRRNRLPNPCHATGGQFIRVVARASGRILGHLADGGA